ncbi:CBS domain containing-hemolysin-like protein [Motilibacter rhizosphaerae]|uniref:CBS domain containing-hemolysin-like protein n=1 Tax=Motilibacter rhizosphaerae TaxID=598652 RepID=A0A4Q7NR31_9ACTN|nr:hemolysin family protein [Motilibacter rhizosphaerae]RZS87578.1 CBS domain containing-hemolysin-like protein [Motilibacter rhizosphaerae]
MLTAALLLVLALVLVLACGVYVAAEFSLLTVDRATVERAAEAGDRGARRVLAALTSLSTQLSGAQVGITITNLAIGYLAEPSIARLVRPALHALGLAGATAPVAATVGIVAATVVTMVFGELVPKNLAIASPLGTAKAVSVLSRRSTALTLPLVRLLNGSANVLLRTVGVEAQEELASARSPQELVSLVRRSAEQGTLPVGTAELLQQSLLFGDRIARDVMTPRPQVHSVQPSAMAADVVTLTQATGHSRFPVVQGNEGDVVGMVHLRHALAVPPERRAAVRVESLMVGPVLVPETLELDPLLDQLRAGGLQAAVVIDEFGGVAGLVTLEDLVEELVGDVVDEHDEPDETAHELAGGAWELSGLLRPDEASRHLGVELPEDDDYETLAGLLTARLGRLPDTGDSVELELPAGLDEPGHLVRLAVLEMDGRRVDRIRVELEPVEPAGAEEGA